MRLLNCTGTKLHEAKFHKGTKLHKDNFAGVKFLHESKKLKKK